jgi:hypothetical protein
MMSDDEWSADQQRRHNLATFTRPIREPRVRRPSPVFTLEELIIAERVELAKEAA